MTSQSLNVLHLYLGSPHRADIKAIITATNPISSNKRLILCRFTVPSSQSFDNSQNHFTSCSLLDAGQLREHIKIFEGRRVAFDFSAGGNLFQQTPHDFSRSCL